MNVHDYMNRIVPKLSLYSLVKFTHKNCESYKNKAIGIYLQYTVLLDVSLMTVLTGIQIAIEKIK